MPALDELRRHAEELTKATGVAVDLIDGRHPEAPDNPQIFVVLSQVTLPSGLYAQSSTDVLFITDHQYPRSALDMFWTEIGVVLAGGGTPANADSIEEYAGRRWRRFSWHRGGSWNATGNGLLDHYHFMLQRFREEPNR
jgi:Prokaryotic E2 family E